MKEIAKKILNGGMNSISEFGVQSFSVDDLSDNLSMSKRTIYKYFPSKDILVTKIFDYFLTKIDRDIHDILEQENESIILFIKLTKLMFDKNIKLSSFKLLKIKSKYPNAWNSIEVFREKKKYQIQQLILKCKNDGYINKDIDERLTSILHMRIIQIIIDPEYLINNNLSPSDTLTTYLRIAVRGLLTKKGINYLQKNKVNAQWI
ncbi:MAG: TetR/AcrR family transcriptional regulator [Candidatus Marinimicrobia bacterium]|nr:TetR/AcrR family transcriptional regulator [Candidatus Neomarinimicrobiota bacterium]